MKKYFSALLFGLMACRPQPIVQAPIVIPVEAVNVEPEPQEKQYISSVSWKITPILPERYDHYDNVSDYFDSIEIEKDRRFYRVLDSRATFTTEGRSLNLECSGGINAQVSCHMNGSQVKLGCDIMFFRVECELK